VNTRRCGGRTSPIADAKIELRLLREKPRASGLRIMGTVRKCPPPRSQIDRPGRGIVAKESAADDFYRSAVASLVKWPPIPGERVTVTGPSGARTVTTDADGIYEVRGLSPEDYSLRLPDLPGTDVRTVEKRAFLWPFIQVDINVGWKE
jgi:hypothetical protein